MSHAMQKGIHRPLFGTSVMPTDARVDPAAFPEEEFPLNCPNCRYLLRGLPEERCPECGEPFDRGRLLVLHYVVWRTQRQRRYRNTILALSIAALLLIAVQQAGAAWFGREIADLSARPAVLTAGRVATLNQQRVLFSQVMLAVQSIVALVTIGVLTAVVVRYRRMSDRRRQVIAGVQAWLASRDARS